MDTLMVDQPQMMAGACVRGRTNIQVHGAVRMSMQNLAVVDVRVVSRDNAELQSDFPTIAEDFGPRARSLEKNTPNYINYVHKRVSSKTCPEDGRPDVSVLVCRAMSRTYPQLPPFFESV